MPKGGTSQNPNKPTRYETWKQFEQASPPKSYRPRIQPRGYVIELVDWGGFKAISISKYVNGTWKSMSINLDRLADVLTMIVDIAKRAGVELEL